ncbi:hypothetical protein AB0D12_31865 [Streptomyces sp. NPDC048479]|uniref:hypothetical protein n=1 Tax=Streptomyces sp. NPDC048479 TaxID=3154725 RepID=UPI00343C85FE
MADTEEQLRARIAELEAQITDQAAVPALPAEHDGQAITWRRWEAVPVILCHRAGDLNGCDQCDHLGPSLIALGLTGDKPVIRYTAHRCPSCQEMRVYHRVYDKYRIGAEPVEIAYSPPCTARAALDPQEQP